MDLSCENIQFGFAVVGAFLLFVQTFKFCKGVLRLLRNYVFKTYTDFKKYGKWAVITGGTSGIGKNIAFELASRGIPIIIISRCEKKLKQVSSEIERKYNVATKTLTIDFKNNDRKTYDKIEEFLRGLDIGILVNNVGMAPPPIRFTDNPPNLPDYCHDILSVNVLSMFRMIQMVLPGMKERRRGLILNMSSMSAITPLPYMALYGSTKVLMNYYSNAIRMEAKEFGIEVQSIMPSFVRTNMTLNQKWSIFTMEPDFYANSVLATVGKDTSTHGCLMHELQSLQFSMISEKMVMKAMKQSSINFNRKLKELNQKQN